MKRNCVKNQREKKKNVREDDKSDGDDRGKLKTWNINLCEKIKGD